MKINEVKYMRRWNLGNYEHDEITVSAAPNESETVLGVLTTLESEMKKFKNGEAPTEVQVALPVETPKVEEKKRTRRTKEEMANVEAGSTKQEEKVEAKQETPVTPAPEEKKEEPAKTFKGKVHPYSRESETHKKILRMRLDHEYPGWSENFDLKQKVAAFSKSAVGKDFLDDKTNDIVPSFIELLKEAMK